jgi:hypothetical protein
MLIWNTNKNFLKKLWVGKKSKKKTLIYKNKIIIKMKKYLATSLFEFLNENLSFNDLTVIKTELTSKDAQNTLNKYLYDLPIFQGVIKKGMSKVNRKTELYYDGDEFIGYYIYSFNHFKFDKDKNPIDFDGKSSYNTINIDDIEIRDSIRKDTNKPKYGKIIIDKILDDGKKYDGITLQANNEKLLKDVYPKYGFVDLKYGGNGMVKWN